jgi:single-strand DNA-binding protein
MSYLKIVAVGNLGQPPELRYLPDGTAICNFSIACNRVKKGEKVTTWLRVSTWGAQAENHNKYLTVGSQVLVEGHLDPDEATGGPRAYMRKNGDPGASYEMTAHKVVYLSKSTESQVENDNFSGQQRMDEDPLPF